jgi:hypothetical protein
VVVGPPSHAANGLLGDSSTRLLVAEAPCDVLVVQPGELATVPG